MSPWPAPYRRALKTVRERLAHTGQLAEIPLSQLQGCLPELATLTRGKHKALCAALADLGLGMEPDLRFGGALPALESRVLLFADDPATATAEASPRYLGAALTLELAVAVAGADGKMAVPERSALVTRVHAALALTESERRRLTALLHRVLAEPPQLAALKRQVSALGTEGREAVGDFLVAVAGADSGLGLKEMRALQSSFERLGLDGERVFAKVHAAEVAGGIPPSAGGASAPRGYRIPPPPEVAPSRGTQPAAVTLDLAKVARLQAETDRLGTVLQSVFAESQPEDAPAGDAPPAAQSGVPQGARTWLGLDAASSSFLGTLLTKPRWSRVELQALARERGLPLDGVLERLNEASFEKLDVPLFEGEDPLILNPDAIARTLE